MSLISFDLCPMCDKRFCNKNEMFFFFFYGKRVHGAGCGTHAFSFSFMIYSLFLFRSQICLLNAAHDVSFARQAYHIKINK